MCPISILSFTKCRDFNQVMWKTLSCSIFIQEMVYQILFYQNHRSFVEDMTKRFGIFFSGHTVYIYIYNILSINENDDDNELKNVTKI